MFDKYLLYRPRHPLYKEDGAYGEYHLISYGDGCLLYVDMVFKGEFASVEEAKNIIKMIKMLRVIHRVILLLGVVAFHWGLCVLISALLKMIL